MNIVVFGANGPTGRLLTEQALGAGHRVAAVTRQPDGFPLRHDRLEVIGADVFDGAAVEAAVAGRDAVISVLGVSFAKTPIDTYSKGIAHIVAGMRAHGVHRLLAVSSSAVDPHPYPDAGFVFNRILQPYVTKVMGKTLYADMLRMENLVRATDLEWTIVRPSGLYELPEITDYTVVEGRADGRYTSRRDLAASLLRLAGDRGYAGKTVGVVTTVDNPSMFQLIRQEAFSGS
ncbi:NAD(P)-dependent oxidoreductase [Nocardia crassostreae]|uniref:NAD(P)-dependent oxidoreductase n=1 Tax=Nocardia crassostreae TaxID=53428 RepID=UPI00082D745E|nr:NAD(P)H-binding protein [Nocardia crassostreae]